MQKIRVFVFNSYVHYKYELREELKQDIILLQALDGVTYITKLNGKPYAKTEDNILRHRGCSVRHDKGFRILEIIGQGGRKVATFDAKKPLDELKSDISNYRKILVARIQENESRLDMDFYKFLEMAKEEA